MSRAAHIEDLVARFHAAKRELLRAVWDLEQQMEQERKILEAYREAQERAEGS